MRGQHADGIYVIEEGSLDGPLSTGGLRTMTTSPESGQKSELLGMQTPPIVSAGEWKAAWEHLLVKEKAHSRARDDLAAERRRMPWLAVERQNEPSRSV